VETASAEKDLTDAGGPVVSPHLHLYRRITQGAFILLILLMPVLNVLRYDSATKELIVFGQIWSLGLKQGFYADHSLAGAGHVALHFFLKGILPWVLVLSVFPLLGALTGRFFCGWLCPEGALFEWADYLTLKLLGRRSFYGRRPNDPDTQNRRKPAYAVVALLSVIIIPLLGGIALTGYFVAPATIASQLVHGKLSFGVKAGIIGVSIYMLIGSLFVRHTFCKFVCAAGLMQMLFGWVSPMSLRLKMDTERAGDCTDCRACEKACFMNVLPRKNRRDVSCVNCGACIDACNGELRGKGLFFFSQGERRSPAAAESCGHALARPASAVKSPGSSAAR
jgi:polyferredoxin